MAKDSQIDPKEVREKKANGGPTVASDEPDGEGRNSKKHSFQPHNVKKEALGPNTRR